MWVWICGSSLICFGLVAAGTDSPTTFQEKEKRLERLEGQQRKCLKAIDGVSKQSDMLYVCRDIVMDIYSDRYRYEHLLCIFLY
jgi:hypothetical protein